MGRRFLKTIGIGLASALAALALVSCSDTGDSTALPVASGALDSGGRDAFVSDATASSQAADTGRADEGAASDTSEASVSSPQADAMSNGASDSSSAPDRAVADAADAGASKDGQTETGAGGDAQADATAGGDGQADATAEASPDASDGGSNVDGAMGQDADAGPFPDAGADGSGAGDSGSTADAGPLPTTDDVLKAVSPDCLDCAAMNGCDDQGIGAGMNNDCEDFGSGVIPASAPTGAGQSENGLCIQTLQCLFANPKCIVNGTVQNCLCGTSGAACFKMFQPGVVQNGPCQQYEVPGLENSDPSKYPGVFTESTRPVGRANNLVVCLSTNSCTSCFPP